MTPEEIRLQNIQRDRERLAAEMEREVQRVREYILYGKMPERKVIATSTGSAGTAGGIRSSDNAGG
jgi:hypothetical protein